MIIINNIIIYLINWYQNFYRKLLIQIKIPKMEKPTNLDFYAFKRKNLEYPAKYN